MPGEQQVAEKLDDLQGMDVVLVPDDVLDLDPGELLFRILEQEPNLLRDDLALVVFLRDYHLDPGPRAFQVRLHATETSTRGALRPNKHTIGPHLVLERLEDRLHSGTATHPSDKACGAIRECALTSFLLNIVGAWRSVVLLRCSYTRECIVFSCLLPSGLPMSGLPGIVGAAGGTPVLAVRETQRWKSCCGEDGHPCIGTHVGTYQYGYRTSL